MEPSFSEATRRREVARDLLARRGGTFRATARRCSLCADDAEDAFQRAAEILLTKAPPGAADGHLIAWMQVVTRREALRLRRERERLLGFGGGGCLDEIAARARSCPAERFERREVALERLALLALLKPDERLAIVLKAQGFSYAEIGELCGWTYTKVNRCLAEGRARLRQLA